MSTAISPIFDDAVEVRAALSGPEAPPRTSVDFDRLVFAVCAHRRRWTLTRIGRYLGVSRQRVLQLLETAEKIAPGISPRDTPRGPNPSFDVVIQGGDWADPQFRRMLVGGE